MISNKELSRWSSSIDRCAEEARSLMEDQSIDFNLRLKMSRIVGTCEALSQQVRYHITGFVEVEQ